MNLAADAKRKPDFRNRTTGWRALIARWSPFMNFEILEHPADVGFRAWGNSLEDVFANCAQALLSIILDPSEVDVSERWEITAHGSDLDSLLVNWLNEVLYYVDTRRLIFNSFAVQFHESWEISCEATGEKRTPAKHPVRVSVKAVTYHQLRLFKTGEQWTAEVFVDV